MEHLKNLLEGARQVLVLDTGSEYVIPTRKGFADDVAALRSDARNITSDLSKVAQYGEQAYNRTGK